MLVWLRSKECLETGTLRTKVLPSNACVKKVKMKGPGPEVLKLFVMLKLFQAK